MLQKERLQWSSRCCDDSYTLKVPLGVYLEMHLSMSDVKEDNIIIIIITIIKNENTV